MNVLFVSNSNPHFRNTNHYRLRALRALGHEGFFFDVRRSWVPARLRRRFISLDEWAEAGMNEALVRRARSLCPEVCLVAGGVEIAPATIRALRRLGVRCLLWTTDPPHPEYFSRIIAAAPEYDEVFCSGTEAVDLLAAAGYGKARWLPFGCDPDFHCPVSLGPADRRRYAREVAFVGSFYDNRRAMFEALADVDLGIWGPLWKRLPATSPLVPFAVDARLDVGVWRRVYSAADIVLVVHYQDGRIPCHQASPKLYEAMACGAFVLCDAQKDAMTLFRDGEHLGFFRDTAELRDKVRYYLERPGERKVIAARGRAEVLDRHTWCHRINTLLARPGRVAA